MHKTFWDLVKGMLSLPPPSTLQEEQVLLLLLF